LALPHFIGEPVPTLLYVTQIGVFLVILAVIRRRQCRQAPQSRYLIGRPHRGILWMLSVGSVRASLFTFPKHTSHIVGTPVIGPCTLPTICP